MIDRSMELFKRIIVYILIVGLAVVIVMLTVSLFSVLWSLMIDPDSIILSKEEVLRLFGLFLLIIIGIELMDTFIIYATQQIIKVEIVLLVAITAIARELIVQDYEHSSGVTLASLGLLIIGSTGAYYLMRKARVDSANKAKELEQEY
jgi:uncharacterized membrane protein (DUF373 family)